MHGNEVPAHVDARVEAGRPHSHNSKQEHTQTKRTAKIVIKQLALVPPHAAAVHQLKDGQHEEEEAARRNDDDHRLFSRAQHPAPLVFFF